MFGNRHNDSNMPDPLEEEVPVIKEGETSTDTAESVTNDAPNEDTVPFDGSGKNDWQDPVSVDGDQEETKEEPLVSDEASQTTPVEEDGADKSEYVIPKDDKPVEEDTMPNPMCGMDYVFSLGGVIGDSEVVSFVASDNEGDLVFDGVSKTLKGCPTLSRDFWIEVELPQKVYRYKCYINENPRLLWKDIPSDQKVKSDKDYFAILSPTIDMVAVSHRGRSHANRGTYRDDDFYIGRAGNFTLSVVADGAGSAQLSSTGSKVFCQVAGAHMADLLATRQGELMDALIRLQHRPGDVLKDVKLMSCLYEIFPATAYLGKNALVKLANDNGVPLKSYHTTALLSITVQIAEDSYFCAAFQIGDGVTVALVDQHIERLSVADSGNFPGETIFVTSNGVFDDANSLLGRIRCFFTKAKPVVISMTDGITDSYFKDNPKLDDVERWKQLLAEVTDNKGCLKPASEICDWLNYYIDQEHDDRTMSIVMYK